MRTIRVALLGLGGVGCEVVRSILRTRSVFAQRHGCRLVVIFVADSHGSLLLSDDDDAALTDVLHAKETTGRIPTSSCSAVQFEDVSADVVIDATASAATIPLLTATLSHGRRSVVLANKLPLAAPWPTAAVFFENSQKNVRFESTVCGGDPAIAMIQRLLNSGEHIRSVRGSLSGSLSFVFRKLCALQQSQKPPLLFSDVVKEAQSLGYTEPDPREDLSGADVRRKVVILSRLCVAKGNIEESMVDIESLVGVDDAAMDRRKNEAATRGNVLRYIAQIEFTDDGISANARVREVASSSVDATLASFIAITTSSAWPAATPLILSGSGAGTTMTAAGIIGDIATLVREGQL